MIKKENTFPLGTILGYEEMWYGIVNSREPHAASMMYSLYRFERAYKQKRLFSRQWHLEHGWRIVDEGELAAKRLNNAITPQAYNFLLATRADLLQPKLKLTNEEVADLWSFLKDTDTTKFSEQLQTSLKHIYDLCDDVINQS